jgi:hypothetical protein
LAAYGGADFGDLVSGQRVRCELLSITIARFAEKSTRSSGFAVIASRCIAFAGAT